MSPDDTAVVLYRLERQDEALARIEDHVKRTNGRVTALEKANAVREALNSREVAQSNAEAAKQSWIVPSVVGTVAAFGSVLLSLVVH